jgi:hypothetical protein
MIRAAKRHVCALWHTTRNRSIELNSEVYTVVGVIARQGRRRNDTSAGARVLHAGRVDWPEAAGNKTWRFTLHFDGSSARWTVEERTGLVDEMTIRAEARVQGPQSRDGSALVIGHIVPLCLRACSESKDGTQ